MTQSAAWFLALLSALCLCGVYLAPTVWGQWLCGMAAGFGFAVLIGVIFDAKREEDAEASEPQDW